MKPGSNLGKYNYQIMSFMIRKNKADEDISIDRMCGLNSDKIYQVKNRRSVSGNQI